MSKQVEVKKEQAVAPVDLASWGNTVNVGQDLMIPKMLIMQSTSVMVQDGVAVMGEYRDSLSSERMGSIAEPTEIIPFHVTKHWDIMVEGPEAGKFKWAATIPVDENPTSPGYNDNLEWTTTNKEGKNIKNVRRLNLYFLLPNEVEKGSELPFVIAFKSTGYREGKKIFNQMYVRNRAANLPPPGFTFKIGGEKVKNNQGTFIVPKGTIGRKTTHAEIAACLKWFKVLSQGNLKVDDSDITGDMDEAINVMHEAQDGAGKF